MKRTIPVVVCVAALLAASLILPSLSLAAPFLPGDLVVERNTFHSWRNETTAPCTMLIVVNNGTA